MDPSIKPKSSTGSSKSTKFFWSQMPMPSEDQEPKICFVAIMAIVVIVLVAVMKPWTIDNRDAAVDFVAPVGVLVFMGLVGCLLPDLE
jgi:hypothetical protein